MAERNEARIVPGTQAAIVRSLGVDPAAAGGKTIDGAVYKPDADPASRGPCAVCGESGVWISGAGRYLCPAHQDDY